MVAYTPQTWTNGAGGGTPLSAARLAVMEAGIDQATVIAEAAGGVHLDSFTGGDDDTKLGNFLSYAAAQTYPPALLLPRRQTTFATANRAFYDGLRIIAPWGFGNAELHSQTKMASRQHLTFTGSWFTMSGSAAVYAVSFINLALTGGSNATFLGQGTATGSLRNLWIHNITAVNLKSLVGTQTAKMLLTTPTFDGWWEINAMYNGCIHIGGSGEGILWPSGGLFDQGGEAYNNAGSSTGQPTIWFDGYDLGTVGPIFMTCEDGWEGFRISGPGYNTSTGNNGGPIRFYGTTIEGRNGSQPCWGSLVRCLGGVTQMRDVALYHAMSDPSAMGHSPQDAGAVDVASGAVLQMDGCIYDRYTGQAESAPFIYARAGSTVDVRRTLRNSKGGVWTGLPRVQVISGATVTNDSSVTLI